MHLGVQEVLVDGREFRAELLVQELDDPVIAAHSYSLVTAPGPPGKMTHGSGAAQATRRAASGQPARSSIRPSRRSWQVPQPGPGSAASRTPSTGCPPAAIAAVYSCMRAG